MRNRITWQNVAAPNFRDALIGTRQAGDAFSAGFEGLANIAGDIRDRQKSETSQAAIAQALGMTDAQTFANTLATGGLEAFGTNPGDLTAEAMKFFAQRGGDLTNQANTRANTARTNVLTEQTQYNLNRARTRDPIMDARADEQYNLKMEDFLYNRERSRANDAAADQTKVLQTQARQIADQVTNGAISPEEAKTQIITQNLPPDLEAEVLRSIDAVDPAQFAIPSEITSGLTQPGTVFNAINEGLDSRRVAQNIAFSSDDNMRLYVNSLDRFEGADNPILEVTRGLFNGSEESPEVNETRASIVRDYESLVQEFDLPPEVIAGVVEETLTNGGILGFGSRLEVDKNAARQKLEAMSTPAARNRLESGRQSYKRQDREIERIESQAEKLLQKAAKATRDGKPAEAERYQKQAEELFNEFVAFNRQNPADGFTADRASRTNLVNRADAAFADAVREVQTNPNASLNLTLVPRIFE